MFSLEFRAFPRPDQRPRGPLKSLKIMGLRSKAERTAEPSSISRTRARTRPDTRTVTRTDTRGGETGRTSVCATLWVGSLAALVAVVAIATPAVGSGAVQDPPATDPTLLDPPPLDPPAPAADQDPDPEQDAEQDPGTEPDPDTAAEPAPPAPPPIDPERADTRDCRVDYRIEARLEDETKGLDGRLELVWSNRSGDAVGELYFHLYWNAFANTLSTHQLEAKGKFRDVEMKPGEWGWQRVTAIRLLGTNGEPADLLPTLTFESPHGGRAQDYTVFRVELPEPIESGEQAVVEVEWESQIPRVRRRTGHKDDFLLVAHWFPKLGVYEAGRGWNCHEFHMNTEFYANFGTYDVVLDLPVGYADHVGGSGVTTLERKKGSDRVEVKFAAPSPEDRTRIDTTGQQPLVHAFTWTADMDFHEHVRHFRYADWAERFPEAVEEARAAFGPEEELALRDVAVRVLVQEERKAQAERHFEATAAALFFYGLWFGEYPYEQITVVDPAWGGGAAGGMEYPTLFTAGTALFTRAQMHRPESVTVHEAGHQFFYGLVGNNEFEAAWLDEGLNSYADSEVLMRVYGPSHATTSYAHWPLRGTLVGGAPRTSGLLGWLTLQDASLAWLRDGLRLAPVRPRVYSESERQPGFVDFWLDQPLLALAPQLTDPRWSDRAGYLADPASDPIDTVAFEYVDRLSYRTNSYPRTAVALRTLAGIVGREAFLRGMRYYSEKWRYGHPYPDDFFAAFAEGSGLGDDIAWYFEDVFRGTGTIDFSTSAVQARQKKPRGLFPNEEGVFVEPEPEEPAAPAPIGDDVVVPPAVDDQDPEEEQLPWDIDVVVRRRGELRLPVVIRLELEGDEDGPPVVEEHVWEREDQRGRNWWRWKSISERKLLAVRVDPDARIWLDTDMSNDDWFDETDVATPLRWSERVFARLAHHLHRLGGIGG